MKICVFCSSSDALDKVYVDEANRLGKIIGTNNHSLVYGGVNVGLMAVLGTSVQKNGGEVIGVIPEFINVRGLSYASADKIIITKDISERKRTMDSLSDAFVILPGGFGTFEEALEMLTLKQLQVHNKPIVFINVNGFYDQLISIFNQFYIEKFAKAEIQKYYHFASNSEKAYEYLVNYKPTEFVDKWFVVNPEEYEY